MDCASAMPEARPVVRPKPICVEDERPPRSSTTPCRSCGSDQHARPAKKLREAAETFQVIVACASCGAAFAALSRN
jgi:DNA-directed RNA polymerase subunit M/transcription elongation factor TFIIS